MIDKLEEALKDERCWSVYVHTNKINNKRYVGITSQKPESRWRNGTGYYGQPFYLAIKKHGWGNFDHEIVASNLTCDEANEFEITLIRELDSHIKKNGYNTTLGGKGSKGCNTDRSMYTGENATNISSVICLNNMEIFNCAKIACDKYEIDNSTLSKYLLGRKKYKSCGKSETGEKLIWDYYDNTKSMEYYIDIRQKKIEETMTKKTRKKHKARKVICLNTSEIFNSIGEANNFAGNKGVGQSCRERCSCGKDNNGNKLYWMYLDEYEKLNYESEAI